MQEEGKIDVGLHFVDPRQQKRKWARQGAATEMRPVKTNHTSLCVLNELQNNL